MFSQYSSSHKCLFTAAVLACLLSPSTALAERKPSSAAVPEVIKAAQKKYGIPSATKPTPAAVPQVTSLSDLVNLQRQSCSWACVTSTFYDYRSVSMYRRRAGLHLGYDIAMHAPVGQARLFLSRLGPTANGASL